MTHPIQNIRPIDEALMRKIIGPDAEPPDTPPPMRVWKLNTVNNRTRKGRVDGAVFKENGDRYIYVIWDDLQHRGPVKQRLGLCGEFIAGLE